MSHPPTTEQQAAIDIARTGESCVIEALAGTGKTTTLGFVAEAMPGRNVSYIAFNKAIVVEAGTKMPGNVTCSTAHSLAMRAIGRNYAHRLKAPRMRSDEIGRIIRATPFQCIVMGSRKVMQYGWVAGQVKKTIEVFCQTGDLVPNAREHMPTVPGIDEPRTAVKGDGLPQLINVRGPNNWALADHIQPYLNAYWADIGQTHGKLPFGHNHYLKLWQLTNPDIYADTILYDEAQDANGCMLAIVNGQTDAQLVFVGDTYQQIYGWNGAVNALTKADPTAPRTHLTESFRFGEGIAMFANKALEWLGADVTLKGRGPTNFVGAIVDPDVILFRTNAAAVTECMKALAAGKRPALVGGAREVADFAKGAQMLQKGVRTYHQDLATFETWGEVQDYVQFDPSGSDLNMLVKLIDDFGAEPIIAALDKTVDERYADLVLSTAHKAKGREWNKVQLWGDFPDPEEKAITDEDVRLLYVAATRAKEALDPTRVAFFDFQRRPE